MLVMECAGADAWAGGRAAPMREIGPAAEGGSSFQDGVVFGDLVWDNGGGGASLPGNVIRRGVG